MYQQPEGPGWHGPGRIVGFEHKVLWTLYHGTPVTVATRRARLANVSEILAQMVLGIVSPTVRSTSSQPRDSSKVSWTSEICGGLAVKREPTITAQNWSSHSCERERLQQYHLNPRRQCSIHLRQQLSV